MVFVHAICMKFRVFSILCILEDSTLSCLIEQDSAKFWCICFQHVQSCNLCYILQDPDSLKTNIPLKLGEANIMIHHETTEYFLIRQILRNSQFSQVFDWFRGIKACSGQPWSKAKPLRRSRTRLSFSEGVLALLETFERF